MFLSKKISKLHKKQALSTKKTSETLLNVKDNDRSIRCKFVEIPLYQKLSYPSPVYVIQGDIPFMESNGRLFYELSLFNYFKQIQNVSVIEEFEQTMVSIKVDDRIGSEPANRNELLDHLTQSNDLETSQWVELLKTYSLTYSKVMQRQSRKKMKSDQRKRFFVQVTEETEKRKQELLRTFPCLVLKFRLKSHQTQLKEVQFTENFVNGMGYSTEEFSIVTLQEGLPQLMPYENPLPTHVMQVLLANYFTIKDTGFHVPELESILLMKSHFARGIEFKTHFLMNYEINTFGMDVIFAVTGFGEPFIYPKNISRLPLNEEFVLSMVQRESEEERFLSQYYNMPTQKIYTDVHKICSVRELVMDIDDSIIVKKCEEDS